MTPAERREAHIRAMEPGIGSSGRHLDNTDAAHRYEDLLSYFDENEPALADAIRYGFKTYLPIGQDSYSVTDYVNYPEDHNATR